MRVRRASRRALSGAVLASIASLSASGAQAQRDLSAGPKPALSLVPRVSATLVASDNFDQRSLGAESDLVARLTAGLSLQGSRGAFKGSLDYALTSVQYVRHHEYGNLQNALSANFSVDLLDDRLQLVSDAQIGRGAVSAFGVQPGTAGDANANVTEVRSVRIAPRWRGVAGPGLRYVVQLSSGLSQASNSTVGDQHQNSASLRVEPVERGRLTWSADASHVETAYKAARSYRTDRASANGNLTLDALDLQLRAGVGHERGNQSSLAFIDGTTWSTGAVWQPSPRTRLSFDREARLVGHTHDLRFEYRLPRASLVLYDARTLSTDQSATGNPLLSQLERDPALRALVLQRLLPGVDPASPLSLGFLQSGATSLSQRGMSLGWTMPRQTVTLTLQSGTTRRVDPLAAFVGDLALTNAVRQTGIDLNIAHRLTPDATLALAARSQRSSGDQGGLRSNQKAGELLYTQRLTRNDSLLLSLRRALIVTGASPAIDENSFSVTLGMRF